MASEEPYPESETPGSAGDQPPFIPEERGELPNHNERLKILALIEENKITAEQGAQLLTALGQSRKSGAPSPAPVASGGSRWLRVRVTDTVTGRAKASITLPFGLVDWGLKIGSHFAPEIGNVNMAELSQALRSSGEGKLIDVIDEEDGEHVEIYVD